MTQTSDPCGAGPAEEPARRPGLGALRSAAQDRLRLAELATNARIGLGLLRHARLLAPLLLAPRGSALRRLVSERPEVWGMVHSPYLAATWTAEQRIARIVEHCRTVEAVGPLLDMPFDAYTRLIQLPEFDANLSVVLDQPRWMLRDGQATFSLNESGDHLFGLSFCLGSEDGRPVAFVGGFQGRREEGILDRYRRVTKAAHGMRPSDLTVDLFRLFCAALKVERVLAVSDAIRHQRSSYYAARGVDPDGKVSFSYDDLWIGRGGRLRADGFFELPAALRRRPEGEIAPNKRSLYRRRYAALESIGQRMDAAVRGGLRPEMRGVYPAPGG